MPRCTMSEPPSHSSSRYLPRRTSRFTSRPTTRRAKFRGTRRRRLGLRTATPVMVLPSTKGSMPRSVISTSGSSGIEALIVLSGPGNIPKLALHDSRRLRMSNPTGFLLVPFGALRMLAAIALIAGCAANPPQPPAAGEEAQDESDADAPAAEALAGAAEPEDRSAFPKQELDKDILYEFLLAEIAGQRGDRRREDLARDRARLGAPASSSRRAAGGRRALRRSAAQSEKAPRELGGGPDQRIYAAHPDARERPGQASGAEARAQPRRGLSQARAGALRPGAGRGQRGRGPDGAR